MSPLQPGPDLPGSDRSQPPPLPPLGAGSLPSLAAGASSLAQSARLKTLKLARVMLYVFGALVIVSYAFLFAQSESEIKDVFDKELQRNGLNRALVDQSVLQKEEAAALRT